MVDEEVIDTITRTDDVIYLDDAITWLESISSVTKSDGYIKEVVCGEEGASSVTEPILNADDYTETDDSPLTVFGS